MRLLTILRLMTLGLLLALGSGAPVMAQGYYYQQPPSAPAYRDPRAYPPGYYPGKLVQPAQPRQGFSLRRFLGVPDDPPPPARQPVAKPRKTPPPATVARPEKPKVNPTTHVVVFGDSLAEFARQGLDAVYAENQDVAIVGKIRGSSNLVRSDPAEWPNFIKSTLDSGQKATLAVVMLGLSDRQALQEGEDRIELLSARWKDIYTQRVDAILDTFNERNIPVVWIGLPPMKSSKLSEDLMAMNEVYRESVQRHGAAYVDIFPGFVDDENRYTSFGPDVDGEPARLRTDDGVSFTKAGARKVAHFADVEIKKILESVRTGAPVAAAPADGQPVTNIEAAIPAPPDPAVPVALPAKPLVGPVLPLTRQDVAPGGTLVSGTPKLNGDNAYPVQRALRTGIAPSSRPGRADDFRWPRS
ncbi:DUF459 domain-containing protein [Microvirga sp. KLBC 81]|uniref:SGNH/GDSL hydrolase family protein n=1 Tax=Microvirga sp. KLBC 81 TaxID=1862707 RepID=UPI000D5133F7|nr:DUF459 domain-containing protein [Microvirga sp. KLBC 81]PVE24620.1 DUF459 domain-containing protein [Microvirga sp. KLBC 81]